MVIATVWEANSFDISLRLRSKADVTEEIIDRAIIGTCFTVDVPT